VCPHRAKFQPMWVMAVDWIIATLVVLLVGLWVIAQLRIWRTRRRNPHGMLMRLPLTAALAPPVHPRGGSGTPAVLDHSRALPQSLACCAGGSGEHLGRVFPWLLVDRKTFARCEPFSFWPHNGPSLAVLSLGHFGDRPEESEQRKTRQYCADNSDCNELRPHCHEPGSQHSCLD
jgi:hypothetical protein